MRFEPDGTTTTIVDQLDGQPLNTPNDLAIDRQGRIWFSNPWNAGNIDPSEKEVLVITRFCAPIHSPMAPGYASA